MCKVFTFNPWNSVWFYVSESTVVLLVTISVFWSGFYIWLVCIQEMEVLITHFSCLVSQQLHLWTLFIDVFVCFRLVWVSLSRILFPIQTYNLAFLIDLIQVWHCAALVWKAYFFSQCDRIIWYSLLNLFGRLWISSKPSPTELYLLLSWITEKLEHDCQMHVASLTGAQINKSH